ncbi:16S rRNA (cytidine(1402)-2'-O)-methyltransferase [Synechococcus sp. PCC 7336]|uniref:16S rRNA (cytidine(1402)-2'-O)-methyltransferase n=1 Tax=Synechococcus sp. PCC 7336 TaxID=195250 RepID=UPI000365545A|nr:16S rRNA (cytidine(1402)-2'-O)-methyltransferase [Synechococcus sp. PCC 7336]
MTVEPGTLYLVGTPIGNRGDVSDRALHILREVDSIAAEDTRHSGSLLKYFGISTPLLSYHRHNIARRTPELVAKLQAGEAIALVTDAGMPGISDPGVELVQACIAAGIAIVPVPGPTALIVALVASGLPAQRFAFEGFLPTARKQRDAILQELAEERRTIVLYEAPHRLTRTLKDLLAYVEPDRPIVVARELTKRYEEFWRGTVASALEQFAERSPRGEFTLVLAGAQPKPADTSESALREQLRELIGQGLSRSQASRQVAKQTGCDRRAIYRLSLALEGTESDNPPVQ